MPDSSELRAAVVRNTHCAHAHPGNRRPRSSSRTSSTEHHGAGTQAPSSRRRQPARRRIWRGCVPLSLPPLLHPFSQLLLAPAACAAAAADRLKDAQARRAGGRVGCARAGRACRCAGCARQLQLTAPSAPHAVGDLLLVSRRHCRLRRCTAAGGCLHSTPVAAGACDSCCSLLQADL